MNGEFDIQGKELISYQGKVSSVTVPAEVAQIGKEAFKGNCEIETVSFAGNDLKYIGIDAFRGCSALKKIELPKGLTYIDRGAFADCSELRYVLIPDTVKMLEKGIFDSCRDDLVILGARASEAEKYAEENGLCFAGEDKKSELEKAERDRAKVETRTFHVFGSDITCSNSLPRYLRAKDACLSRKQAFYDRYVACFPRWMGAETDANQIVTAIEAEETAVIARLINQGVGASKKTLSDFPGYLTEKAKLYQSATVIFNAYTATANTTLDLMKSGAEQIYAEAESKVTGTGIGIIGDPLDVFLHSIDEYRTKKKQWSAASAQARSEVNALEYEMKAQGSEIFNKFLQENLSTVRKYTDAYLDVIWDYERHALEDAGLIEGTVADNIDIKKSEELMRGISGYDSFDLGFALKKNPMNMDAHVYAIENNLQDTEHQALIDFLGIRPFADIEVKRRKDKRYNAMVSDLRQAVVQSETDCFTSFISKLKAAEGKFKSWDLTIILKDVSDKISAGMGGIVEKTIIMPYEEIPAYCRNELPHIVSESSWQYLAEQGLRIPGLQAYKYEDLLEYLVQRVTQKVVFLEKQRAEEEARRQEEEAKRQEEERQLAELREARKRANKKRLKIFGAILLLCICIVAGIGVYLKVIVPNNNYNAAVELMETENYEEAIAAFEAMGGYKDSDTQIENCHIGIKDRDYAAAVTLMNEEKYEEAISAFEALNGHKDSGAQIENCRTAIKNRDYAAAVALMDVGDLDLACDTFISLGDYKDSAQKAANIQLIQLSPNCEIGDYIKFGVYEQDNDSTNGKEAIEWLVLDIKDENALIISKYALDGRAYNALRKKTSWDTSTLREWLNNEFIDVAFSFLEEVIIPTDIPAETVFAQPVQDKIFLLSNLEVNTYFDSSSAKSRLCKPTAYAKEVLGLQEGSNCTWCLRAGNYYDDIRTHCINNFGQRDIRWFVDLTFGVRPAMWIKLGE